MIITILFIVAILGFVVSLFLDESVEDGKRFMRKHFPEEKY